MGERLIVCIICGLHFMANLTSKAPRTCPRCQERAKDQWK